MTAANDGKYHTGPAEPVTRGPIAQAVRDAVAIDLDVCWRTFLRDELPTVFYRGETMDDEVNA